MSLARIALRAAAVEALKGRTRAQNNVLDSEIGIIDNDATGKIEIESDSYFIAVYTDAGKAQVGDNELRALLLNGRTEVLFETGVTAKMLEVSPKDGTAMMPEIGIPDTDGNFEFTLDLISREIAQALTDPDNVWSQIFLSFIYKTSSIERGRVGNVSEGIRLAAHQTKITVDLIDDPEPLRALDPDAPFARFIAMAKASDDESLQKKAAFIEAKITGEREPWERLQQDHGMTAQELLALGLGPLPSDVMRETPSWTESTIDMDGVSQTQKVP
ncbi:hypothetical protein [Ochrobactrum sp. S1502_03]|uniref:hypothetical protein n=1 Tax=Ochrobactrum sp. S1502_03 TaxID=3108451 RepID=UPI0037CA5594